MKIARKVFKVSLLSLMIGGTAFANSTLATVGTLQANNNVSIQNELGSFPVSGDYTMVTGDRIVTSDGDVTAISLNGGHIYVSPNSTASIAELNGRYVVELVSGSVGYDFDNAAAVSFKIKGETVKLVSIDGKVSGALALGLDDKLVVNPMLGEALATSESGVTTTIAQGQTWIYSSGQGVISLTQATEDDDDSGALWWILGGIAAVAIIADAADDDDDDDDDAPVADGSGDSTGGNGLPPGVTQIIDGVPHTGLTAPAPVANAPKPNRPRPPKRPVRSPSA